MKVSTRGRYGLRIMIELAARHGEGPVMMSTLAECQQVSRKYIHSILTALKNASLVRAVRGAHGGYVLAEAPEKISALQVLQALEGSLAPVDCVENSRICSRSRKCAARMVWEEIGKNVNDTLKKINLKTLALRQKQLGTEQMMYYI
ncbi:MAG: Rrf2 family transcriptional regulator [Deltaproteobacteria bacterium]|nr:MAG: Rrf2 family transcriptional regulator [Deltaproteobacteria bacterium]